MAVETITIAGQPFTLDELSAIVGYPVEPPLTNADIEQMQQAISDAEDSQSPLATLIGAVAILSLAALLSRRRPGVAYLVPQQRYIQGRTPLPDSRIEALIARERQRVARRTTKHATDVINGRISLREYQRRMARDITRGSIRMMQAGAGGRRRVTRRHLDELQQQLWGEGPGRGSLRRLQRHVERIANGELTPGQILDRSRRYGSNIDGAFYGAEHINRSGEGWEARRTLDPTANHCPQCPAYQQIDWVPASQVVPKGVACSCGGNCRCQIFYRKSGVTLSDSLPIPRQSRQSR
jgi:hypothetical protein